MVTLCSPDIIGIEFRLQKISSGRSPLATKHDMVDVSPTFAGSSPKSNGVICGGTFGGQGAKYHIILIGILKGPTNNQGI